MNDLTITVNGFKGVVTVALTMRNGIALPTPQTMEIPIDMWVMAACKIIESGIRERADQMKTDRVNGFRI